MLYLIIVLSWILFNTWLFLISAQIDGTPIATGWDELFSLALFSILGFPAFIILLGIQKLKKMLDKSHKL